MVDMTNQKDKLKNLTIIIITTILLFLFGADLLALLLNSLGVRKISETFTIFYEILGPVLKSKICYT